MGWQLVSVCILGGGGVKFENSGYSNYLSWNVFVVNFITKDRYVFVCSTQLNFTTSQYVYCLCSFVVSHRVHANKAISLEYQVPVSRSVGMVWWREMRSVTVAPLTPPSAGRGTPVVHLAIAPSMQQLSAGEDTSTFLPLLYLPFHCCHPPLT